MNYLGFDGAMADSESLHLRSFQEVLGEVRNRDCEEAYQAEAKHAEPGEQQPGLHL